MRTLTTILIALAIVGPTTALALDGPPRPGARERFVVDTQTLTEQQLQQGIEAADGELVRVDETLGFAVLELGDTQAFAEETGASPTPDARGEASTTTPIAEVPDDEYLAAQWGPAELNAPQVWRTAGSLSSPTVGIVDSGIDTDHPDHDHDRITHGSDFVDGDQTPEDLNGHGTHVAGIVAAVRDNGEGIAGMTHVDLFVNRVFDENAIGWCSDFASGIREAVDEGADVINFSGHCNDHAESLHDAVAYAEASGVPVVVSAGNAQFSSPEDCVRHPAIHGEAIAVGATDPALTPGFYSCQGPEVELAAPGTGVLSTVNGGGYAPFSGTSMAAPYVAATAAMLIDHDPSITVPELRERLTETARDLGEPGHDEAYGHGMVDPVAALTGFPVWAGEDASSLEG